MEQQTLRKLQLTELEILRQVRTFCQTHDINYTLMYGTALGAVRHGGFIPWDDDIDIAMPRDAYDAFIRCWKETGGIAGYYLQGPDDPEFREAFLKIRKNDTVFVGSDDFYTTSHQGIWIDIFPLDKVADTAQAHRRTKIWGALYLLYGKSIAARKNGTLKWLVSGAALGIVPKSKRRAVRRKCLSHLTRDGALTAKYHWISTAKYEYLSIGYPPEVFCKYTDISFEGQTMAISAHADTMLRLFYGDYMQLPPEEDRVCKHSPQRLDFGIQPEQSAPIGECSCHTER